MTIRNLILNLVFAVVGFVLSASANAQTRIVVLEFELKDITSMPNTPEEIVRTATFKPMLETALNQSNEYEMIKISANEYRQANSSFGYLYKFHDIAASLGKKLDADWIIVSQHSKPSFLFSHLNVNVIDVNDNDLKAFYNIELKGTHDKVSQHAIRKIAEKIDLTIKKHS